MSRSDCDEQAERAESQVFCCYAPDLRPLAILLSTVHFSPRAIIQISRSSLHVEVELGKILQAHAYLEKSAFTDWHFNPPVIPSSQREKADKSEDDNDDDDEEEEEDDAGSKEGEEKEEEGEDNLEEVRFEVSMSSLIECLNVFGTATSQKTYTKHLADGNALYDGYPAKRKYDDDAHKGKGWSTKSRKLPTSAVRISYDGEGHPLVLLIEDSGVVTRCSLMTYEADELAQMEFPVERQMVHLIMKSDWLKSAFSQFDDKSGTEMTFMFAPSASAGPDTQPSQPLDRRRNRATTTAAGRPTFRIQVDGDLGCYTVDFPNDKDILDSFLCKTPEGVDPHDWDQLGFIQNSYKLSHILKIKKALDVSSKTSLRVDDTGFLSLQLLIPLEESSTMKRKCGYVEFMCVPIEGG